MAWTTDDESPVSDVYLLRWRPNDRDSLDDVLSAVTIQYIKTRATNGDVSTEEASAEAVYALLRASGLLSLSAMNVSSARRDDYMSKLRLTYTAWLAALMPASEGWTK